MLDSLHHQVGDELSVMGGGDGAGEGSGVAGPIRSCLEFVARLSAAGNTHTSNRTKEGT